MNQTIFSRNLISTLGFWQDAIKVRPNLWWVAVCRQMLTDMTGGRIRFYKKIPENRAEGRSARNVLFYSLSGEDYNKASALMSSMGNVIDPCKWFCVYLTLKQLGKLDEFINIFEGVDYEYQFVEAA